MTTSEGQGSIHGRFQPFHNGHLEYLKAAVERCDHLYIGITQYRRRLLTQVQAPHALHRALPESNPLSYFERLQMIDALLRDLQIESDSYSVVPFPIEESAELPDFLPTSVEIFTTVYDEWNERKISLLAGVGYKVTTLWSRPRKAVTGQEVRRLLEADDPSWRSLVPRAVASVLDDLDMGQRLRDLTIRSEPLP